MNINKYQNIVSIILSILFTFFFVVYFVYSSPGTTTIGEDISTTNLTASGNALILGNLSVSGNSTTTNLFVTNLATLKELVVSGATTFNNVSYSWPSTAGSSSQVLTTDGSGNLYWKDVSSGVSGSGTSNFLAKWIDATTLSTSTLYESNGKIGLNTTTPTYTLDVNGSIRATKSLTAGINVETLTGNKTLTPGVDAMYQYLDPNGDGKTITLVTTTATAGDRFIIRNNGDYDDYSYLLAKQGNNVIDEIYSGAIKEFIFDGTNWISAENGTGESDYKGHNVMIGHSARGNTKGTAVGYNAQGQVQGVGVGYTAVGKNYGVAVGYYAYGYNYGAAMGKNAGGYDYGAVVGCEANGKNRGVVIGYQAKGMYNGLSFGYQAGHNLTDYANPNKNILIGYKAGYNLTQPSAWAASTVYSEGDYVRPTSANGYNYECVSAGTSGDSEPTWPTTLGETVIDGTVTWKCVSIRGNNNIIIGYDIEGSAYDADNLNIGNVIYGNLANGNIGIGTTTPAYKLQVAGDIAPTSDNAYDLGKSNLRWANLYAASTTVGDLIFNNNFRIVETKPNETIQSLIIKNQKNKEIMKVNENGELKIKKVKTTGITIYDSITGQPYCIRIANGEWLKQKGECK